MHNSSSNSQSTFFIKHQDSDTDQSNHEEWTQVVRRIAPAYIQKNQNSQLRDPKLRVQLWNLVLLTGLPQELKTSDTISNHHYLGRYGKIKNVIISTNKSSLSFNRYNDCTIAHITYQSTLDAAFAIALRRFEHFGFNGQVSYGTSKYCFCFIQGRECQKFGCPLIHEWREEDNTTQGLKESLERHYNKAEEIIRQNVRYFIEKQYEDYLKIKGLGYQKGLAVCTCLKKGNFKKYVTMPTIKETLQKMIKQGTLNENVYQQEKEKYKEEIVIKKKREVNCKVKENYCNYANQKNRRDYDILKEIAVMQIELNNSEIEEEVGKVQEEIIYENSVWKKSEQENFLQMQLKQELRQQMQQKAKSKEFTYISNELSKMIHKKLIRKTVGLNLHLPSNCYFATRLCYPDLLRQQKKLKQIITKTMIN